MNDTAEIARKPPKNALPSPFEAWAKAKRDDLVKWQREWDAAKKQQREQNANDEGPIEAI